MKKLLLSLVCVLGLLGGLRAQEETISIGSGDGAINYSPTYVDSYYSVTQQIFTAAEMQNKSGKITSVTFASGSVCESIGSYAFYGCKAVGLTVPFKQDSGEKDENGQSAATDSANTAEVIIAKNRHGPTNTVKVAWNGDYTLFSNLETIRNDM